MKKTQHKYVSLAMSSSSEKAGNWAHAMVDEEGSICVSMQDAVAGLAKLAADALDALSELDEEKAKAVAANHCTGCAVVDMQTGYGPELTINELRNYSDGRRLLIKAEPNFLYRLTGRRWW